MIYLLEDGSSVLKLFHNLIKSADAPFVKMNSKQRNEHIYLSGPGHTRKNRMMRTRYGTESGEVRNRMEEQDDDNNRWGKW